MRLVPKGCIIFQELVNLHIEEIPPPNDAYPDTFAAQEVFQGRLVFPLKNKSLMLYN